MAMRARGGGEYDVSDADIEKFYEETITGSGGDPPKGIVEDLRFHALCVFGSGRFQPCRAEQLLASRGDLRADREVLPR